MSIGDNIRNLRIAHGLSQQDLADIAGVTDGSVSNWENNTKIPRMGPIQRIADYFGIKKSNIIEEDGLSPMCMHRSKMVPVYDKYRIDIPESDNTPIDCVDVDLKLIGDNEAIAFKVNEDVYTNYIEENDIIIFSKTKNINCSHLFLASTDGSIATPRFITISDTYAITRNGPLSEFASDVCVYNKIGNKFDSLYVVGKAVEIRRRLKDDYNETS